MPKIWLHPYVSEPVSWKHTQDSRGYDLRAVPVHLLCQGPLFDATNVPGDEKA